MTDTPRKLPLLRDAAAILLGLTVPAMVSGRAVLQGLAALCLVLALILAAADPDIRRRWREAVFGRFGLVVLIAFAGMAVSIPGSLDPLRSADAWARTLAYIGACVLFWAFLAGDARARRLALSGFVLLAGIGALLVAAAQLGFRLPLQVVRNALDVTSSAWAFTDLKAYAAVAACMVPVLVWLAVAHACRPLRWGVVGTVAIILCLLVTTGNKSAIAGLLAAALVVSLAAALRRRGRWLAAWPLVAAAVVGAVVAGVYELPDAPPASAVWPWMPPELVDTHRQQIWRFTASKIAEAPWTGWGINCIDRAPGAHDIPTGYRVEVLPSHPHNWVLEILAETGVIGLLPVLAALLWYGGQQARRHVLTGEGTALARLALWATFWGSSLFNFSIWSSWWLITFFLLTALMAAGQGEGGGDSDQASRPPASAPGNG